MKAIFTGGGTGGHIYPAVSVAQSFIDKYDADISYIGSLHGMEKDIVESAGISFHGIHAKGLTSKNPFSVLKVLLILFKATLKSMAIIKKTKPDFVFATGGYVAAPVAIAAGLLKIPLFIHEQNAVFGLTNRLTSRFADIVFTTFPDGSELSKKKGFAKAGKVICSGLPVRSEFLKADKKRAYDLFELSPLKKTVLVTGGSRGARFLNQEIIKLYPFFVENGIQLLHVIGQRDFEETINQSENISEASSLIKQYAYLNNMYDALQIADVCISRAGASFLAEMTFIGKPGLIIPFPYATHNHQVGNARALERQGAVIVIEEKEMKNDGQLLKESLEKLIKDDKRLQDMQQSSQNAGVKETLEIIEKNIAKEIGVTIEK